MRRQMTRSRRCADPFRIPAIRRAVEIECEDLVLGQLALQRERHPDLAKLSVQCPGRPILQKPRNLHRQRRCARYDLSMCDSLSDGPQCGTRIDTGMIAEPLVFVSDQNFDEERIDLSFLNRQSPSTIRHRIGAQKFAVPVQYLIRGFHLERREHSGVDPMVHTVPRHRCTPHRGH